MMVTLSSILDQQHSTITNLSLVLFTKLIQKFGNTVGIQCACNALYAICFSIIKKIEIWKTWDLDYILDHGDAVFKMLNISRSLFVHELPKSIAIEKKDINVELLANYFGVLGQENLFIDHFKTDIGNGLIFMTGYSFSLIWSKTAVFLFDSHSRDINGAFTDQGTSIILLFQNLSDVEKYIKSEYSKQLTNFNETQFELQYIRVITSPANVIEIMDSLKKGRRFVTNKANNEKES